jgi:hypothetical protein
MDVVDILQSVAVIVIPLIVWRFPRSPKSPNVGKWVEISHATKHEGGVQETKGIIKRDTVNSIEVEEKGFRKVVMWAKIFNMVIHEKEPSQ